MKNILVLFLISSNAFAVDTAVAPAIKKLVFCAEAKPATFNPQLATDGATFNASSRQIYNRLVELEHKSMRVVPSLAESFQSSSDGKTITMHLREGVKFQTTDYFKPTRNFNADDVLFSFERMRNPGHPYHHVGGGSYPNFEATQMGVLIESVEKVDPLTVKFKLKRPEAPFLANLAMDFASILSEEYAKKLSITRKQDDIDTLPIGTGPFAFKWYEKGQSIQYVANPDYFGGKPKIDQLVFDIVPDPETRLQKLIDGVCQVDVSMPPHAISTVRQNPNIKVMASPGLNISYLSFNMERQPFANLSFRKAVYYALNREEYLREVYNGQAQVAKNPIPPTMWSFNRKTPDLEYSPEKARALLKESGIPPGFEIELYCTDVSRPYNPDPLKLAGLVRDDLAKIGIKVNVIKLEWQEFLKKSRSGDLPFSLQGWTGDNGDPDNFLHNLLSCDSILAGNNRAHWCNRKFSYNVDRARVTTNVRLRTKFYEQAQEIFREELPWVPIAHNTIFKALRRNVEGYQVSPFGVDDFAGVYLK